MGVAPPGLRIGLTEPDVYTPLPIDPAKPEATGSSSFQCYGRLKPGVTLDTARAEMAVIASALARRYPLDEGYGVFVSTLHDYLVADGRYALQLLMARRRGGAPHRLREPRRPADGARARAPDRAGGARFARRQSRAARCGNSSIESLMLAVARRSPRPRGRLVGHASAWWRWRPAR